MKQSVTQKLEYGCGVACFAFVCNMSFTDAILFLGKEYSVKHGWRPSDLQIALERYGMSYKNSYVRKKLPTMYAEESIVLLERSSSYPFGHYLVRHENLWMDPWINMPEDTLLENARSGFRPELPGRIMYLLAPL